MLKLSLTPLRSNRSLHLACTVLASILAVSGCSDDSAGEPVAEAAHDDHDGHDHGGHGHDHGHRPETFAEAVEAIAKIDDTIKTAFAADDKDAAHGPLHTIGEVLEGTKELAKNADLTDDQRKSVDGAVDSLFESFGAIDAVMHGEEGKSYDEVSAKIAESIKALAEVAGTGDHGHDHDDHDHGDHKDDHDHEHADDDHADEKTDG